MNDRAFRPSHVVAEALLRRPLVLAAGLFMTGIFAHAVLPRWPGVYLLLAAVSLAAQAVPPPRLKALWLALCLFLCGLVAAQLEGFAFRADEVALFAADEPTLAQLELRIVQPPRIVEGATRGERRLPPRQVTQARVLRVLTRQGWQPATGTIQLAVAEPHHELRIRQRISAFGLLHRPAPAANPGQFDWQRYYRDQRILATLQVQHAGSIRILESPGPGLLDRLRARARSALERGFPPAASLDHALLRALVLGDGDPQLRDVQDQFMRTGTSHHLAISGMHIAILGALVLGTCRILRLSPRRSTWIGMVSVCIYGLVALPSPPVVRSVLLCLTFGAGLLGRRSLDGVQFLALSVLAMLVYHPLDLYNAGFQLSFGTVLGLMLFTPPVLVYLRSWRDPHQLVAEQVRKPAALDRLLRWLGWGLTQASVAGLVAWTVSAPLIAFHFNQLNPWAIPASLAMAVPVFLALVGGLLKIVLTLLVPLLAAPLAQLAALPVEAMRWLVDLLARLPGSDMPLAAPPTWLLIVFYALLAVSLFPAPVAKTGAGGAPIPPRPPRRRYLRLAPALALLLLALPTLLRAGRPHAGLELTLVSVGAGQCAVVRLPSGGTLVVDAGSSGGDIGRTHIAPLLKQAGLTQIDTLILSHANYDHFSGVESLASLHTIRRTLVSPLFRTHAAGNRPCEAILATLDTMAAPQPIHAGQHLQLDDQALMEVLWPPPDRTLGPNESSVVLRISCGGQSVLLCGDIQEEAQRELLDSGVSLKADVLVAPHHGGCEATTEEFVGAVEPEVVLSSSGRRLSGKQRAFDALTARYAHYRTGRCGAIRVRIGTGQPPLVRPMLRRQQTR